MEQQTSVRRCSQPDPFDDINTAADVSNTSSKLAGARANHVDSFKIVKEKIYYCPIFSDIYTDLLRRVPYYLSDYYDSKQRRARRRRVNLLV